MGIPFYKVSGAGNDFIALAAPREGADGDGAALDGAETQPAPADVADWCRRGLSVGADGLFVIHRRPGGAVRMVYQNADGGRSELCLNGSRCAAELAFSLGWGSGELELITDAGTLTCRRRMPGYVDVDLPPGLVGHPEALPLEHHGQVYEGWRIEVGIPHYVLPWDRHVASAPVAEIGSALRSHRGLGPAGANVNFVRFAEKRLDVRTFERGVEAETLACGTGVVAAAAVGAALGLTHLPATAITGGGYGLGLSVRDPESRTQWTLGGDARIVHRGEILDGARGLPAPPW
ncbi:MAG: diaminopimelate epimerase [Acidobacteriota bacterium]